MKNFGLASYTLASREIIRFLRQRNRVMGALGQPLLFWLFLGFSFKATFQIQGTSINYVQFFFPGIINLILLFTAIFSTFSLIEDRNEGFLQGVLVSPASRSSIVFGKVLGGSLIALLHAGLFLIFTPFIGLSLGVLDILTLLGIMLLTAVALTSFGFCLAWKMDSTQGFHAIMMLVLMPLLFLSGAFFPSTGLTPTLNWLMKLNPLTYAVDATKHILLKKFEIGLMNLPSLNFCLMVIITFGVVAFSLSLVFARKK